MDRRLAAILAADVCSYTRLMGVDEAGTLRRSTDLRQAFLEPLIDGHHGRIVKLVGDGVNIAARPEGHAEHAVEFYTQVKTAHIAAGAP